MIIVRWLLVCLCSSSSSFFKHFLAIYLFISSLLSCVNRSFFFNFANQFNSVDSKSHNWVESEWIQIESLFSITISALFVFYYFYVFFYLWMVSKLLMHQIVFWKTKQHISLACVCVFTETSSDKVFQKRSYSIKGMEKKAINVSKWLLTFLFISICGSLNSMHIVDFNLYEQFQIPEEELNAFGAHEKIISIRKRKMNEESSWIKYECFSVFTVHFLVDGWTVVQTPHSDFERIVLNIKEHSFILLCTLIDAAVFVCVLCVICTFFV